MFKSSNQGRNTLSKSTKRKSSEGTGPPPKRSNNTAVCSTPRPEARPVPKPKVPDDDESAEPSTYEKLQSIENILQDLRDRKSETGKFYLLIFSHCSNYDFSFLGDVKPSVGKSEAQVNSKAGPSGSKSDATDDKKGAESDIDMTEDAGDQTEKKS